MKVYEFRMNWDDFSYFDTGGKILRIKNHFNGVPYQNWEPLKVNLKNKRKSEPDMKSIFASLFGVNFRSKSLLEPFLKEDVEFLPLIYKKDHWLMNALKIIDAIDYEQAVPVKTPSGIITHFNKYSFYEEKVKELKIFKIPEFPTTILYVTDVFKKFIEDNQLTGAEFLEIWNSEKEE